MQFISVTVAYSGSLKFCVSEMQKFSLGLKAAKPRINDNHQHHYLRVQCFQISRRHEILGPSQPYVDVQQLSVYFHKMNSTLRDIQGVYKLSEDFAKPYFHEY